MSKTLKAQFVNPMELGFLLTQKEFIDNIDDDNELINKKLLPVIHPLLMKKDGTVLYVTSMVPTSEEAKNFWMHDNRE